MCTKLQNQCYILAMVISAFYVSLAKHADRSPTQTILEEYLKPYSSNLLNELDETVKTKFTRRHLLPRARHHHHRSAYNLAATPDILPAIITQPMPYYNIEGAMPQTTPMLIEAPVGTPTMPVDLNSQIVKQLILQAMTPYVNTPSQVPQYSMVQNPSSIPYYNRPFYVPMQKPNNMVTVLNTPLMVNYPANAQNQVPVAYQIVENAKVEPT